MAFDKEIVMLCNTIEKESDIPEGWIIEQKADGTRTLFIKGTLMSRRQKVITKKFPEIKIPKKNCILDGEICVMKDGKTDFNALQNHNNNRTKAVYLVFDIIEKDGINVCSMPLKERRKLLPEAIYGSENVVFIGDIPASYQIAKEKGWEGIIAKNPDSPYEVGVRSPNWLKLKIWHEATGTIKGTAESDSPNGFTIEFLPDNESVSIRVAVQDREDRQRIMKTSMADILEGKLRGTIQYYEKLKSGAYRMPTWRGFL